MNIKRSRKKRKKNNQSREYKEIKWWAKKSRISFDCTEEEERL
jgi:hypothetical protein